MLENVYKFKDNSLDGQGVLKNTSVKFLETAYNAVQEGVKNACGRFSSDPNQFDFRSAKPMYLNCSVKKEFKQKFMADFELRGSVKHLKSFGVDYYLLGGKALVCFKKMDKKSRVSGFYSKRFKALMKGESVPYSKQMLENLALMGIHKPLPIYFVGYVLDSLNRLVDVRLVNYRDSTIAYEVSLMDAFKLNLFTATINQVDDKLEVKSKINKKKAQ